MQAKKSQSPKTPYLQHYYNYALLRGLSEPVGARTMFTAICEERDFRPEKGVHVAIIARQLEIAFVSRRTYQGCHTWQGHVGNQFRFEERGIHKKIFQR